MVEDRKHTIFLSVVGIATLVVAIIGATFAWFSATVTGNNTASSVKVQAGTLGITYADGSSNINLTNAMPGASAYKTFTIQNTGGVQSSYKINWKNVTNGFVKTTVNATATDNLVYKLEMGDATSQGGTYITQTETAAPATGATTQIGGTGVIPSGKTQTYKLTITFKELGADQNSNQGKSFVGNINVTAVNQSAAS